MKKLLVILLVLMTCFVANVNAQEWRWTSDLGGLSNGEYKLTKIKDEFDMQFISGSTWLNSFCLRRTIVKEVNIENQIILIHIQDKNNGCAETKLYIKLDGSGGLRSEYRNNNWVKVGVKNRLKFIGGAPLESLVAALKDKSSNIAAQNELKTTNNTNPIAQVQNQELSNTKIIDDTTKPLITIPVNIAQAEPEKAKTPDTNDSVDQKIVDLSFDLGDGRKIQLPNGKWSLVNKNNRILLNSEHESITLLRSNDNNKTVIYK